MPSETAVRSSLLIEKFQIEFRRKIEKTQKHSSKLKKNSCSDNTLKTYLFLWGWINLLVLKFSSMISYFPTWFPFFLLFQGIKRNPCGFDCFQCILDLTVLQTNVTSHPLYPARLFSCSRFLIWSLTDNRPTSLLTLLLLLLYAASASEWKYFKKTYIWHAK